MKHCLREAEIVENVLQELWEVKCVHRHARKCFELYKNIPDSYSLKDSCTNSAGGISAEERGVFTFILMLQ